MIDQKSKKRKKKQFKAWAIFCEGEIWGRLAKNLPITKLPKKEIDQSYFSHNMPPLYLKRVLVSEL